MTKKLKLEDLIASSVKKVIREIFITEAEPLKDMVPETDGDEPKDPDKDMSNPHKNEPEPPKAPPAPPAAPNGPDDPPTGQEGVDNESPAAQQAHELDLIGKPFGNFADKTGKVVAKSVNGGQNLVKIEPDEPSTKLGSMLPKDTEPGYDPYAPDAKTTLKHQKPHNISKAEKNYYAKKDAPDPRPAKAAATLMKQIKDVGKAKLWTAAKMAKYQKDGNTKDAIRFGEILKALDKAEETAQIPQDVKNDIRDTTAFSRAANPTADFNKKVDKGMDDMMNEPPPKLGDMMPPKEKRRIWDNAYRNAKQNSFGASLRLDKAKKEGASPETIAGLEAQRKEAAAKERELQAQFKQDFQTPVNWKPAKDGSIDMGFRSSAEAEAERAAEFNRIPEKDRPEYVKNYKPKP